MVIRKYIATTEEEATRLAREELGEDAVIMNVKQVSAKGLMRFFRKPSVELTAAVDEVKPEDQPATLSKTAESQEAFPDFSKLQEAIQETNAVLEAEAKKEAEREQKKSEASGREKENSTEVEEKPKRDVYIKSENIL